MKKYILISALLAMFAVSGCAKMPAEPPQTPPDAENTQSNTKKEPEKIKHEPESSADTAGYNKVSEYAYDFDSDGEDDTVELLTTAQVENGEVHSDDGQNWLVTVSTADGVFTLCKEYIQLGAAELDIGEFYNEEPQKVIILTTTTGAGKSIRHFTFSDGAFYEQLVYTTDDFADGGANIVGSIK